MADESQVESRPLTAGQNAAIQLAYKEQQRLFDRAKQIQAELHATEREATAVMARVVSAIKEDLELDQATPVVFEDVDGKLAIRWTTPSPGPSLVKP